MNADKLKTHIVQEYAEPVAGRSTVPIWLIVAFGLLFYWCQLFLAENAGGFNKEVYHPFPSYEEVAASNPQDPGAKLRAQGLRIFTATCAACHQASGLGNPGNNVPPLAGSEWVQAEGGNRIAHIVLYGLTGPISVKGQEFNGGTMLPWHETYTDDQIAAVLTYIRSQWGNKAGPIEPQMVKAARAEARTTYETPDELLKMPMK
jgi:mono/diheme cytochrome c family protein